jgi:hypothetical protein
MNNIQKEYVLVVYTKCFNGYENTSMIFLDDLPSEFYEHEYYFVDNSNNHQSNNLANKLIDYISNSNHKLQTTVGMYGLSTIKRPEYPFIIKHMINVTCIP